MKQLICASALGQHYPRSSPACKACVRVSGPGVRKSPGHPRKVSQSISALAGQEEKTPEATQWVSFSLGNTILGDKGWMSH